jgi:hypothetical protein
LESFVVLIAIPPPEPLDALEAGDELAAGALELELLLALPHPATTSAAPNSATTTLPRSLARVTLTMIFASIALDLI